MDGWDCPIHPHINNQFSLHSRPGIHPEVIAYNFINLLYILQFQLVIILLVSVYVIYTLTGVPDDDPRKGSKHVGLVYKDYM
jgi:hypothetical protein